MDIGAYSEFLHSDDERAPEYLKAYWVGVASAFETFYVYLRDSKERPYKLPGDLPISAERLQAMTEEILRQQVVTTGRGVEKIPETDRVTDATLLALIRRFRP